MLTTIVGLGAVQPPWFCRFDGARQKAAWIDTELGRQKVGIVSSADVGDAPALIVFLHADSPSRDPVYQYDVVQAIARSKRNVIAAGVLRPGYRDDCGDVSDGVKGRTMGDNYTADVVDSLAVVLERLQQEYQPSRTVLIGHSGGAALSALIASRHPTLQDQAILVACPCDLPAWRQSMLALMDNPRWADPMEGLSPIDEVAALDRDKNIRLFVGDRDEITPPFLSEEYARAATRLGKNATVTLVPGGDHDMILDADIFSRIVDAVND